MWVPFFPTALSCVGSVLQVYAANMHGDDFYATRAIRQAHFPAGELDDGGNAEPPLCVMLPASDGSDGACVS